MILSDFRTEARRRLDGKWGKAALITLAYWLISFLMGFIQGIFMDAKGPITTILSIAFVIIELPLTFGITIAFLKLYKSEDVKVFDFITLGFKNFEKAFAIGLRTLLKLIVPLILLNVSVFLIVYSGASFIALEISGVQSSLAATLTIIGFILFIVSFIWLIVKSFYYSLTFIIAADDESLTSAETIKKSKELMTGNRAKLFLLYLSFVGWIILASFIFGIGFFLLAPYMLFSTFAFYFFVAGKTTKNKNIEELPSTEI